jgi:hypothetical protein
VDGLRGLGTCILVGSARAGTEVMLGAGFLVVAPADKNVARREIENARQER